ncbi:vpr protein [Simian immunodeficiency virus]|uniref:Protein Vpr n=1 Tax=Simian immunodeficiency virus (isolate GB1) TaxID=11732 RepID=VPR_SIVGB|nr:RecName: Full=Protein Vpr; AltName: Full=R ORF protein; AltName: Full=Viral protein R [Simian immunodeficiency virus (ISOLATE GB1)]pir/S28083/ vpr protein - simian immunodeficiency virus [Simian immunodeficiency virus]AAB49571.1 vpr protein [Simian immunodeficiency virus]
MGQKRDEQVSEDQGPPREPYNQWLADTMEEIKEEARKHFPLIILNAVSEYCVQNTGSEEEACEKFITLMNRAIWVHLAQGCDGTFRERRPQLPPSGFRPRGDRL